MAKRFCIIKVSDGLGNQLFQYALARQLNEHGFNVHLDISWYENIENRFTQRNFKLWQFKCEIDLASDSQVSKIKSPQYIFPFRSLFWRWQTLLPYFKKRYFKEQFFGFDKNVFRCASFVYFDGFWQSHKYFDSVRNILLNEVQLQNKSDLFLNFKANIKYQKTTVAIHVRRGDYTSSDSEHILLDDNYFKRAIEIMLSKLGSETYFYFFSDDTEYVINQDFYKNVLHKVIIQNTSEEEDLILIKTCKHQIISNSTFSWWGAWLNENPEKVVICPSSWFHNSNYENPHLIPEKWIRI